MDISTGKVLQVLKLLESNICNRIPSKLHIKCILWSVLTHVYTHETSTTTEIKNISITSKVSLYFYPLTTTPTTGLPVVVDTNMPPPKRGQILSPGNPDLERIWWQKVAPVESFNDSCLEAQATHSCYRYLQPGCSFSSVLSVQSCLISLEHILYCLICCLQPENLHTMHFLL